MNDDLPQPSESGGQGPPMSAVPALDMRKYRAHVEDLDLSEEQKNELLGTLWWIMASFVQLGFAVDSVQHVLPAFAEASSPPEPDALEEGNKPGISGSAQAAPKEEIRHEP